MDARPELTREQQRELLFAWRRAAPVLEEERRQQARNSDTIRDIPSFDGLLEMAVRQSPPSPSSGLVEFHRRLRGHREANGGR